MKLGKNSTPKEWTGIGTGCQGGGGVTIPGSVQGMFRCCTKRHGLVGKY